MVCQGVIRGRTIELEHPVPYHEGEVVTVSIEHSETPERGTGAAVLKAVLALPDIEPEAVDELEEAIRSARLPVRDQDWFGDE
jgi:hypothetical protein